VAYDLFVWKAPRDLDAEQAATRVLSVFTFIVEARKRLGGNR
jgi:hypothetical protein